MHPFDYMPRQKLPCLTGYSSAQKSQMAIERFLIISASYFQFSILKSTKFHISKQTTQLNSTKEMPC